MKTIITIILFLGYNITSAQSIERAVIGSTGGTVTASTVIITSTVGEVAVASYSGTLTLTQGYQQSNSQSVSVKEIIVKATFSLFPNPTTQNAKLEIITENASASAKIELYSSRGKLISSQVINLIAGIKSTTKINLSSQAAGVYFVKIKDSQSKLSKTLRVIKQ